MREGSTIGENIRAARRFRGMSIETLAGLIGRSKGWLSKVENGHLRLERRSDIHALAEALGVAASDLLGEPMPAIHAGRHDADVVRLREALLDTSLDDPLDVAARPIEALASLACGPIAGHRRAAEYRQLATLLPGVIAELHMHAAAGDEREQREALRLLVDMCTSATFVLRHLGQVDLAWIAADRVERAARRLDEPVPLAAATFAQAHSRPSASLSRPLRRAAAAADALESHLADSRQAMEVYGMLRLSAALSEEIQDHHDAAGDQVAEAERVAALTGEHADAWQSFGPANVGTWKAMLSVEAGKPEEGLAAAAAVRLEDLPSRGRKAALAIEKARALAMLGRDGLAVRELGKAEKMSADRVHRAPLVRDLVASLYDRAPGRELRGLAWRMNII